MTIEEFIEARLAEDEAIANTAGTGDYARWEYVPDDGTDERGQWTLGEVYAPDTLRVHRSGTGESRRESREYWRVTNDSEGLTPAVDPEQGQHIARHDPARVLRQVAALRAMMKHAEEAAYMDNRIEGEWGVGARDLVNDPVIDTLMHRDIAAIWRDHPDYRPEWDTPDQA